MTIETFDLDRYVTLARSYKIAITIPTYRRPDALQNLLEHLLPQISALTGRANNQLTVRILIAENDMVAKEGAMVAAAERENASCEIICLYEARKGVSAVRNTLTAAALNWNADFILFIDDDEWPSAHWVEKMVETADVFTADIVSAPVIAAFEGKPPEWIVTGNFFTDDDYKTGETPNIKRTSNLLIRASWLRDKRIFKHGVWFHEALGHYGGEDSMLIESLLSQGAKHVWCREASVQEWVPRERQTIEYLAARAYRFGNIGLLYRSMLRPGIISGLIRTGKTSYLIIRWAILSGRYLAGQQRRKQHFIELQTVLGRVNAHRGSYREHY